MSIQALDGAGHRSNLRAWSAESVSFFPGSAEENVQVIEVAHTGIGLSTNKRDIFLRLPRRVDSL